jgi:hypothetical protein
VHIKFWLGNLCCPGQGFMAGSCEYGNECSGSIKIAGNFMSD